MLGQLFKIVELLPVQNSLAIRPGIRQLSRVSAGCHNDGLGFDALRLSTNAWFNNHVVVTIKPTPAGDNSNTLSLQDGEHVLGLALG